MWKLKVIQKRVNVCNSTQWEMEDSVSFEILDLDDLLYLVKTMADISQDSNIYWTISKESDGAKK